MPACATTVGKQTISLAHLKPRSRFSCLQQQRRILIMKVRDIMTSEVEVIRPEATIHEAAQKMRTLDVGSLPVCDGRRLVGMLTDRDIAIRAVADGRNPDETLARDTMSPEIVYCFDDDNTQRAEQLMMESQI